MSVNSSSPYDCQSCGACCATEPERTGYLTLSDEDVKRLRGTGIPIVRQEALVGLGTKVDVGGRRVCAALEGDAGRACSCRVYEQRPCACRVFEAGSFLCRLTRRDFGLPE